MLSLCNVAVSQDVLAEDAQGISLAIDYTVPPDCPSKDRFVWEVMRRLDTIPGEVEPTEWVVRIEGGSPMRGWLQGKRAQGSKPARYFEAESCQELTQVLALAAALAIHARETRVKRSESTSVTEPAARVSTSAPAERPGSASRWESGVGLIIERTFGLLPETAWRPGFFVEVAHGRGTYVPLFRLGVGRVAQSKDVAGLGSAEFTLLTGRLEGCWPRVRLDAPVEVMPCAALEAGTLSAKGRDVPASRSVSKPWFAGGTALRASVEVMPWLAFEGAGALSFPVYQTRYVIEPEVTVHQLPSVAWSMQMGAVVRF